MPSVHLLSVGYDERLMHTRAAVLRQAGFVVDEAFDVNDALKIAKSDSIDAMVICHTVSRSEQRFLISSVRMPEDYCQLFASVMGMDFEQK